GRSFDALAESSSRPARGWEDPGSDPGWRPVRPASALRAAHAGNVRGRPTLALARSEPSPNPAPGCEPPAGSRVRRWRNDGGLGRPDAAPAPASDANVAQALCAPPPDREPLPGWPRSPPVPAPSG